MEKAKTLITGLVVGLLLGLWFGVNIGKNRPFYSNPFEEVAEIAKVKSKEAVKEGKKALRDKLDEDINKQ